MLWAGFVRSRCGEESLRGSGERVFYTGGMSYTLRIVLLCSTLLCASAGLIGAFMMLRRRSLIADVVGHSALHGLAIAFLAAEAARPGSGQEPAGLLVGAMLSGLLGALAVIAIDRSSRLKSDAALAIVLSVFYGLGAALFTVVQDVPTGNAAGLSGYLSGKTASLMAADVKLFAAVACVLLAASLLLFKELTLLCFDADFAAAQGWPTRLLDVLLTGLVVGVTILGMQSVGLILVVATLVIPPTAARFWTDDMRTLAALSGALGAVAAVAGVLISSAAARVAVGPTIVLCGATLFGLSVLLGTKRGVLVDRLAPSAGERGTGEQETGDRGRGTGRHGFLPPASRSR